MLFSLTKLLELLLKNKLSDHNASICEKGMEEDRDMGSGWQERGNAKQLHIGFIDRITIVEKALNFYLF